MAVSKQTLFKNSSGSQDNSNVAREDLQELFTRLKAQTGDFSSLTDELRRYDQSPDEYWYAMGSRLSKILRERLYRTAGFRSFSDYCARGLGYSRQHTYKLMKVVCFIDERWARAKDAEARKLVENLFMLGFTKLYVLHSLPSERLDQLLHEGVSVKLTDGREEWLSLEMATIGQIKRALAMEPKSFSRLSHRISNPALANVIIAQARSLLQLTDQCDANLDNHEAAKECLHTMREHVSAIIQGLEALAGKEFDRALRTDN